MKYFIASIILIVGLIAGCKKSTPNAGQTLTGKWRLLISEGGLTGTDKYVPPANETHTLQINNDYTYLAVNNAVQRQGGYRLQQVQSIYTNSNADAIIFDESPAQLYTLRADTLIINDNHVEPYSSAYVRLR